MGCEKMIEMDKDGLLLCKLQALVFELSVESTSTSSEIFMRRFFYSKTAKMLDDKSILQTNLQAQDILSLIEQEYSPSNYGSTKYTKNEMYWIGYIYRYFSYTYNHSSRTAYTIIKPKELKEMFLAYHTLSPEQTIERILEAKNIAMNTEENELKRQFEIYKKIRKAT